MCKGNCRTSIYSQCIRRTEIYIYIMCESPFQFVYVNQGEFFVSHANVETSLAIAFVMGDDRLFVLVYQPVIITYLCGKREPSNHHRVCAYAALSSMLIYSSVLNIFCEYWWICTEYKLQTDRQMSFKWDTITLLQQIHPSLCGFLISDSKNRFSYIIHY